MSPDTTDAQREAVELLQLDGTLPERITIAPDGREGATTTYIVVLDHGWAQRNLTDGFYEKDARAVALALSALLAGAGHDCPVEA